MLHFLNFPLHWVLLSCEIDFRPAAKPKIYDKLPSIKFKFWMHWLYNEHIVSAETMIPIFLQLWMWILVKLASIIAKRCALVSLTARRAKRRWSRRRNSDFPDAKLCTSEAAGTPQKSCKWANFGRVRGTKGKKTFFKKWRLCSLMNCKAQ